MTTATFDTRGSRIEKVTVKGHSGLVPEGEPDVLCAAITSAVNLTATTVNEVLGAGAAVKIKEEEALISLKLPGSLGKESETACQSILAGLMVYLSDLAGEYPENLSVLENMEV